MKNKNNRFKIIEFLLEKNNKNKTEKNIKDMENSFNSVEKAIKNKRFTKLKRDLKEPLLKYFENKDNQKILIDIFTQEEINDILNSKKIPPEKINKLKEVSEYYSKYYPLCS